MTIGELVGKVPSKQNLSRAMPPTTGSLHRTGVKQIGDNRRYIFWPAPGFWKVRRDQVTSLATIAKPFHHCHHYHHCRHCQTIVTIAACQIITISENCYCHISIEMWSSCQICLDISTVLLASQNSSIKSPNIPTKLIRCFLKLVDLTPKIGLLDHTGLHIWLERQRPMHSKSPT